MALNFLVGIPRHNRLFWREMTDSVLRRFCTSALGIAVLIFVLALALRLYRIDHQSLWLDEAGTLEVSSMTWHQMDPILKLGDNGKPPLYYFLMHLWLFLGHSEWWVRLPSALLGAGSCAAAALLGMHLLGERGWLAGVVMAFSPFNVWYSQETRMYTFWAFWCGLALLFHVRYCLNRKNRDLLYFVIFSILTLYSFTYGFFLLALTGVMAILHRPRLSARELWLDAGAHVFSFVAFIPWLHRIISAASTSSMVSKGRHLEVLAYAFNNLYFGAFIGLSPEQLHATSHPLEVYPFGSMIFIFSLIISFLVLVTGLVILYRNNWNAFVFCAAGIVILLGPPFFIAIIKSGITNNPRYGFPALFPAVITATTVLLAAFERPSVYLRILAGCLVLTTTVALGDYYFVDAYSRDNMRAAMQAMAQDKDVDVIFVTPKAATMSLRYYYTGTTSVYPIDFYPSTSPEDEADYIRLLASGAHHPALIYLRPDLGDPQHGLPNLFRNLYHQTDQQTWTGVTLFKFERAPSSP
jgi:uncharacterized membrane protein